MSDDGLVLSDIRVLDLSEHISGPFCTKLLAGLGAEVIKVETPGHGDVSRRTGPFLNDVPHQETSAAFLYLNTGKKSVTLDPATRAGAGIIRRMAATCDVLVENFQPGYMDSLGLGYAAFKEEFPGLIYTSVSPYGQAGPYRDYIGSDIVAQAVGGLMYPIGLPEREPLQIGGSPVLHTAGISAFSATMLALYARDVDGLGQHVDVSVMETTAVTQIHSSIGAQFNGADTPRRRNTLLQAKDGWVNPGLSMGVREDTWARICDLMGKPELAQDPRFTSRESRRENQEELDAVISEWVGGQAKEDVYHTLQGMSTIAGYVATVEDLFDSKQISSREFFQSVDHPYAGEAAYPGAPFTLEGQEWRHERAPLLGEHNREVYCGWLGYAEEELARLRSQRVI